MEQKPYEKCQVCGQRVTCEHGKCPLCQECKPCKRLDDAWQGFGEELKRMGKEEPGW